MVTLILTIICSSAVALILKYNDFLKGNKLLLIASNYLVGSIIAGSDWFIYGRNHFSSNVLLTGATIALFFVVSLLIFSKAIEYNGAALSTTSSRLSVIIPFVLSIIIFDESLNKLQLAGFIVTIVTIILFYFAARKKKNRSYQNNGYIFLVLVLIGIGLTDFSMKIFQSLFDIELKSFFLFTIFGFAFLYCMAILIIRKSFLDKKIIFLGALLGVPNIFSSYFLVDALNRLPAVYVYPAVNVGVILLTTLIVRIFWNEKISLTGWAAIIAGILSVILLTSVN